MLETGLHKFVRTAAIVVALSSYLVGRAAAFDVPVTQPSPIKIAVFPFELEDFSAASQAGSAPSETTALAQSTEEAKQQLLQSGRYVLVDAAGADIGAAKEQGLRKRIKRSSAS